MFTLRIWCWKQFSKNDLIIAWYVHTGPESILPQSAFNATNISSISIRCLTKPCQLYSASSYELVHMEFMNIKRMLSRNGFPNNFLDRCIQQCLNRKHGVTQQSDSPAEPVFLKLFYSIAPLSLSTRRFRSPSLIKQTQDSKFKDFYLWKVLNSWTKPLKNWTK